MAVVCISGGFDPIHDGHLDMIEAASLCGEVHVILNSDEWLTRKKGFVFLPWKTRARLLYSMKNVANVHFVDDSDNTVCATLKKIHPDYFANGGDRTDTNTPEKELCEQMGIKMLWGVGGGKTDSSSDIARRAVVQRKWGTYEVLAEGDGWKVKRLVVDPRNALSYQSHQHRTERWFTMEGTADTFIEGACYRINKGSGMVVPAGRKHQLENKQDVPLVMIEIQYGDYLGEDDIQRFS